MPSTAYSLRAQTLQSLTAIKRPDVPWPVVLRNTSAVVLPLGVGLATGHLPMGLGMAVGALNTMICDQPGPYRQRMRQLLLASLAAAAAAFTGFTVGAHWLPMLLATALCGFFGGLLVVFGADLARTGLISIILLVVTAATPMPPAQALGSAALIFAGGLLLTAFSLAAWPLQRYRPERLALATVYAGLAALARQPSCNEDDAPELSEAMTTLQHTLLGRHRAHGRAMEAFGVLLELAERIRLELIALSARPADAAAHAAFRADAARVLTGIARALRRGEPAHVAQPMLEPARTPAPALPPGCTDVHRNALAGQLSAAARNANWASSRGEWRASAAETALPRALRSNAIRATLRANLTVRSTAFRHAVRMATCLALALALARVLALPHGYWLPMTAAIVLRPDFGATFNFGLLRVVGTVLGLVLTSVLLYVTPAQPWAHLALLAVLCAMFRYLASAHYGMAVATLTGVVVILLAFDGVDPGVAVMDRVINTALGCGVALLAYVAWPTWERGRARAAQADMLDAYAGYLRALAHPEQRDARREMRTQARLARTNAQASIERMRVEPATPPALLELARALFANGNRLARTAMALEAMAEQPLPAFAAVGDFIADCAEALQRMGQALRAQSPLPELPDLRRQQLELAALPHPAPQDEALRQLCDRLVDNIDTLAHVVGRSAAIDAIPRHPLHAPTR